MRHDRHYVDELTRRNGEGIGRMIRIDAIESNADQPRTHLGNLDDLVGSIRQHGVLEPLLVRKGAEGKYQLVSGERRFAAAKTAGLEEVPCIELHVVDEVALEIALIENLQRQDLNPFEEAEGFNTLISKYGYSQEQVAGAIGKSRVTVSESIKLLALPEEIRLACRHADIHAKGILLEIAKAPDVEAMHAMIQAVIEGDLDRQGLRDFRQELKEAPTNDEAEQEATAKAVEAAARKRQRPAFVFRWEAEDKPFKLALSFRTEKEPEREDVIAALEELLAELRAAASEEES